MFQLVFVRGADLMQMKNDCTCLHGAKTHGPVPLLFVEPVSEYIKKHKEWDRKRLEIEAKNDALIEYWRSIPWWKFWAHVPFEKQRRIILANWESLRDYL